jgi:hypothetical protein
MGVMQLEVAWVVEITKLVDCVGNKEDPMIQIVRMHQNSINSEILQTARCFRTELQRGTRQIQDSIAEKTEERWRVKKMSGQMPSNLDEKLVVSEQSYRWLKFGDIQGETESTIVGA